MILLLIVHWFISALALLATAYLVRGFHLRGFASALVAALAIGAADVFIRPVLLFLTLPLNILTLGLFTFVVNGVVIRLCAAVVPGFKVDGWGAAIFGAFVLALFNTALHYLLV